MNAVIDALRRVIPIGSKRSGRGWISFDCPFCGDRRGRGGILETPTGGFRYHCWNGGCEYEKVSGWEPVGYGLVGRARRLFLELGGDLSEIPHRYLEYRAPSQSVMLRPQKLVTVTDFPVIELPKDSVSLWQADGKDAKECRAWITRRGVIFRDHQFCWSPKYPRHVLVPLSYRDQYVGWIARKIDPDKKFAHIKCPGWPTDFMLNQDKIHQYPTVLVMEGTFDAIALRGLCTFGNTLSEKQINLLNQSGKQIALLPDYQKQEWRAYWQAAKQNGWYLAIPEWPGGGGYYPSDHIKDAGDAIKRHGLLYTIELVMNSLTRDYHFAEIHYGLVSR